MQVDVHWVRRNFQRFNADYFGGKLPEPRFVVGRARTRLGSCSWKRKTLHGHSSYFDFTIAISNYYDQEERDFQNVLLHEMIHLSIAHSGVKDSSSHGVLFRGMMERLNREGWDIQVSHSMKGVGKTAARQGSERRNRLVLAIETDDGRCFLSCVNTHYAYRLDDMMRRSTNLKRFAWYLSDDPWFDDKPVVRSLRGIVVSPEVFREKTKAMTPFELRRGR